MHLLKLQKNPWSCVKAIDRMFSGIESLELFGFIPYPDRTTKTSSSSFECFIKLKNIPTSY